MPVSRHRGSDRQAAERKQGAELPLPDLLCSIDATTGALRGSFAGAQETLMKSPGLYCRSKNSCLGP